ncbi:MAG: hypothetical protein ABID45_02725 [Patescibacteria group bacterium]
MKKSIKILITLIVIPLLLLIIYAVIAYSGVMSILVQPDINKYNQCSADADCTLVACGGCDCDNDDGSLTGINKKYKNRWNMLVKMNNSGSLCHIESQEEIDNSKSTSECIKNTCKIKPKK